MYLIFHNSCHYSTKSLRSLRTNIQDWKLCSGIFWLIIMKKSSIFSNFYFWHIDQCVYCVCTDYMYLIFQNSCHPPTTSCGSITPCQYSGLIIMFRISFHISQYFIHLFIIVGSPTSTRDKANSQYISECNLTSQAGFVGLS